MCKSFWLLAIAAMVMFAIVGCNPSEEATGGDAPAACCGDPHAEGCCKEHSHEGEAAACCGKPEAACCGKPGAEGCCKTEENKCCDNPGGEGYCKKEGEPVAFCPKCGEIPGSDACCAEGAEKCEKCGLNKGSPGCCRVKV